MEILPHVEKMVTEEIGGKQVQKQIYADGSYGIRNGNEIMRYYESGIKQLYKLSDANLFILRQEERPDGSEYKWHDNGQMRSKKLPDGSYYDYYRSGAMASRKLSDGTEHEWYPNGQMKSEKLPGKEKRAWDERGYEICYEANDFENIEEASGTSKRTEILREIIAKKIDERDRKNPDAPKTRVVTNKTATKVEVALKSILSNTK